MNGDLELNEGNDILKAKIVDDSICVKLHDSEIDGYLSIYLSASNTKKLSDWLLKSLSQIQ